MNTAQKLEQAKSTLTDVIDRYDCMGWFDGDDDQMAEAKGMETALEAGDEIAVGVALDTALERYDCMGAFACDRCGQGLALFGYMNPCECGDEPDQLAEEAKKVQTALEILRGEGNDEVAAEVTKA